MKMKYFLEGFFVAAATCVAYFLSYYFELGYANAFNMPTQFISVSIASLINVAVLLALVIFALFDIVFVFYKLGAKGKGPERRYPNWWKIAIFIAAGYIIAIVFGINVAKELGFLLAGFYTILFIVALFVVFKALPQFSQDQGETEKHDNRTIDSPHLTLYSGDGIGRLASTLLLFLAVLPLLVTVFYQFGYSSAINKTTFYVEKNETRSVLLRAYGDTLVFGRLTTRNRLAGDYKIVNTAGYQSTVYLTSRCLGSLRGH